MDEPARFKDLIVRAQNGDSDAMEQLINRLQPLIRKYSYQLGYEDAKSELILWIIETIHLHKPNKIWETG